MDFKKYLVVKDYDDKYHIWTREEYDKYTRGCGEVGAGSAYKVVIHFEGDESLLSQPEKGELWKEFLAEAAKRLYAINAETISEHTAIVQLSEKYALTRKEEVPEAVRFAEWCVEFYGWSDTDELWVGNVGEKYSSAELYELFVKTGQR